MVTCDYIKHKPHDIPANTRHLLNVGSMLDHCLRRWPNIDPTLGGCLVFAGMAGA